MPTNLPELPLSILELAAIREGSTPTDTFHHSLELAQHAERWGYQRFWLAEHHNMASIASSATAVLIGHIAGGTSTIRVGSGGVMLPNHAPLIVAEQFGTLASLYPGRIDLGLGRAPGTDQLTAHALRRDLQGSVNDFPQNVQELLTYLSLENRGSRVRAIPGEGLNIPVWLLGSSTYSAQLAAYLGLPFAFASHFAPAQLQAAMHLYRENFRPSQYLAEPYAAACVNVIAAETTEEAERLATSFYQLATNIVRGTSRPLQPPVDSMDGLWSELEEESVRMMMAYAFVGGPAKVRKQVEQFVQTTQVNELLAVSHIYDPAARLRSYELLMEAVRQPVTA